MNSKSRISNSFRNIMLGIPNQVIILILGFVSRSIFVTYLGTEYLGINGLFSNILGILSFAELGIGNAIVFSMYKPLADNDTTILAQLMQLYKKAYKIIGLFVAIIGILLIPFLGLMINSSINMEYIILIYLLFLLNSVLSYFLSYKRSIITADQKNYIVTIYTFIGYLITFIFQTTVLIMTKSFVYYLTIQLISTALINIAISKKANMLYPFLKQKQVKNIDKDIKKKIIKDIKSLTIYKIGGVILNSTDNIIISSFVGVIWVGYYSNYNMLIMAIIGLLNTVFYSIYASLGNLNATENIKQSFYMFKVINFICFWIFTVSSLCFWILTEDFIILWLGNDFVLSESTLFIIVLNFYILGMQNTVWAFRDTLGLFKETKYVAIVTAVLNLIISIVLAKRYGLNGVLWGTAISRLLSNCWYEPYVLYKVKFNQKVKGYYIKYICNLILGIILALIISVLCNQVQYNNSIITILIKLVITLVISNSVFILCYGKSEEFKYIWVIFKRLISNVLAPSS